jgi:3-oxoacyl-[acyl-carrier protein] reductase
MRSVVVSGGGTGIGHAVARRFVRAGDRVAILGRRESVLRETTQELNHEFPADQPRVLSFPGDISDPPTVRRLSGALADFGGGRVDVLVNNVGGVIPGPDATLEDIAENWMSTFRSNVLTGVLLTEALSPHLRRPGGRIINLSSIAAFRGGGGAYSAAKAAVVGWTLDLAARYGPDGITVNVVAPGYITGTEFFGDRMTPARHDRLVAQTLDGRAGQPDDVASMIFWIASEEMSHLTGQVLQVNGGALLGR